MRNLDQAGETRGALLAERNTIATERDKLAVHTAKLEHIVAAMRRAAYGRRSESIDDEQLALLAVQKVATLTGGVTLHD